MPQVKLLKSRVAAGPGGRPVSQSAGTVIVVDDVECFSLLDNHSCVLFDGDKNQPCTKKEVDDYRKKNKSKVDKAIAKRRSDQQKAADAQNPDALAAARRAFKKEIDDANTIRQNLETENQQLREENESLKSQLEAAGVGNEGDEKNKSDDGKGPNRPGK